MPGKPTMITMQLAGVPHWWLEQTQDGGTGWRFTKLRDRATVFPTKGEADTYLKKHVLNAEVLTAWDKAECKTIAADAA